MKAFHYKNDSIDYTYTYKYDAKGNKTMEYISNSKDSLLSTYHFEYDETGHHIKTYYYYPKDTLKRKELLIYDNDVITGKKIYKKDEKLPLSYHYMYDDFDEAGNWLKMTIYLVNSRAYEYLYRKIEYY